MPVAPARMLNAQGSGFGALCCPSLLLLLCCVLVLSGRERKTMEWPRCLHSSTALILVALDVDCICCFHCTDQAALVYLNARCSSLSPTPPGTLHKGSLCPGMEPIMAFGCLGQQMPINTTMHRVCCAVLLLVLNVAAAL